MIFLFRLLLGVHMKMNFKLKLNVLFQDYGKLENPGVYQYNLIECGTLQFLYSLFLQTSKENYLSHLESIQTYIKVIVHKPINIISIQIQLI